MPAVVTTHIPAPRTGFRALPLVLGLPLAVLAGVMLYFAITLPFAWRTDLTAYDLAQPSPGVEGSVDEPPWLLPFRVATASAAFAFEYLQVLGWGWTLTAVSWLLILGGALASGGFVAAFFRRGWAIKVLRLVYITLALLLLLLATCIWAYSGTLESAGFFDSAGVGTDPDLVALRGSIQGPPLGSDYAFVDRFWWWYRLAWPTLMATLGLGVLYVLTTTAAATHLYTGHAVSEAPGDRVVEDVRVNGRDPRYRKSWLSSTLTHAFVLLVLPWLLSFWGCVRDYRVPEGSGNPAVAVVQVVQPKKVVPETFILNPNAAILLQVPDLDDSDIEEQVTQLTEQTYVANNAMTGAMGAGGGTQGGWPDGMGREPVRFIRLQHGGSRWDEGMSVASGNADLNFLAEFERQTGFKTANTPEAHAPSLLSKYSPGYAPPFVYMTGDGSIKMSAADRKALRTYAENGGLLWADAGGAGFDRNLRRLVRDTFGKELIPLATDDPLFQMPHQLQGAPYIAPHGPRGPSSVWGVKDKGRWMVLYTPTDINDAWKDDAQGVRRDVRQKAYAFGVNVVYYAFTHYLEETRDERR